MINERPQLSDEALQAISELAPDQYQVIMGALAAFARAETVIDRHWKREGVILPIKAVMARAHVSNDTASTAVAMARRYYPQRTNLSDYRRN
jgi:hypothetical protein